MKHFNYEQIVVACLKIAKFEDVLKPAWEMHKNDPKKFIEIVTPLIKRNLTTKSLTDELREIITKVTDGEIVLETNVENFKDFTLKEEKELVTV